MEKENNCSTNFVVAVFQRNSNCLNLESIFIFHLVLWPDNCENDNSKS